MINRTTWIVTGAIGALGLGAGSALAVGPFSTPDANSARVTNSAPVAVGVHASPSPVHSATVPAVGAVPAVRAIPARAAVPAVRAVRAVPARPATPAQHAVAAHRAVPAPRPVPVHHAVPAPAPVAVHHSEPVHHAGPEH